VVVEKRQFHKKSISISNIKYIQNYKEKIISMQDDDPVRVKINLAKKNSVLKILGDVNK
jgi:hypothetical protein